MYVYRYLFVLRFVIRQQQCSEQRFHPVSLERSRSYLSEAPRKLTEDFSNVNTTPTQSLPRLPLRSDLLKGAVVCVLSSWHVLLNQSDR